jgi:hypothetical protein
MASYFSFITDASKSNPVELSAQSFSNGFSERGLANTRWAKET